MKRIAAILTAAVGLASAQPAGAFDLGLGLFKRKSSAPATPPKSDGSLKIKQLVATLQSDPDTDRRKVAAETLRTLDPRNNTDVIPALVNTLQNDPSAGVRAIAAESLGSIKSVYPLAGSALENSEKSDPDANVRALAKAALWQYHINGYKTPTSTSASLPNPTGEPPLSTRKPAPIITVPQPAPAEVSFRPITQGMGKGVVFPPTAEPPLAKSKSVPPPTLPDSKPPLPTPPVSPIPVPMPMPAPELMIPDLPAIPSGGGVPTVAPPKR